MSYNNRRPYEFSPIPTNPLKLGETPRGKGILINVTMQIPFMQIYTILKTMYEQGQAKPEDLQTAAAELRKVADLLDNLASTLP